MIACTKLGMHFVACTTERYFPNAELVALCEKYAQASGGSVTLTEDVEVGTKDADVIYTDVWVSMGEPDEIWEERIRDLTPYKVTAQVMKNAGEKAIFLHCLPAFHDLKTKIGKEMGERFNLTDMEVTDEVFESAQSKVFDEAENRMHTIKAVMVATLGEKVDSTNSWIKRLSKEGAEHGTLAVAEFQSAGRGRFDRKWEAPEGSSVMMTILLRPEFEPQYASMLTLVMGLAVAQAVDELGFKVSIKWPNDVVLSRKKICGILTEMGTNGTKIGYVLIGVGINVNLWEFPEEMQDKATSLAMESGQEYDRNQIIGLVMKHFEEDYERFIQTCDFENLLEEYHRILANLNQPVRVLNGADSFEGVSRGIDTKGELLVEKADGTVTKISAGEVSVRGLYSYV